MRISTPEVEGELRASKWLKIPVLVSGEEMRSLFKELGSFYIYTVSEPVLSLDEVPLERFLEAYDTYIEDLKGGALPKIDRALFSSIFTSSPDVLYAMEAGKKWLIKATSPCIQLQAHHFYFSKLDGKFHSMVLSRDSVAWGIQFSYPQLMQDPKKLSFHKVDKTYPNTALFQVLAKWVRNHTIPTPFLINGERINVPMRSSRECLAWIDNHPQLKDLCVLKS